MLCKGCGINKLSNEFPDQHLSDNCSHAISFCMRCVTESVRQHKQCPVCKEKADPKSATMQFIQASLDSMFKEFVITGDKVPEEKPQGNVTIVTLTGDKLSLPYCGSMTVLQLKQKIFQSLKYDVGKQKLLHNEKELMSENDGCSPTLCCCGVRPGDSIFLLVLLYAVPEGLNETVFDLYWGYPNLGRDYLDASCLLFKKMEFYKKVDYRHMFRHFVTHSGDVMDDFNRIGHHTINVNIKEIPPTITHLFFTLSAWHSPNISQYPNPSLRFFEKSKPNENLCQTSFNHAGSSQAVIMCFMARDAYGMWNIYNSGHLSAGNAANYRPLISSIQTLIRQGI